MTTTMDKAKDSGGKDMNACCRKGVWVMPLSLHLAGVLGYRHLFHGDTITQELSHLSCPKETQEVTGDAKSDTHVLTSAVDITGLLIVLARSQRNNLVTPPYYP
jgi:hypothetical protein